MTPVEAAIRMAWGDRQGKAIRCAECPSTRSVSTGCVAVVGLKSARRPPPAPARRRAGHLIIERPDGDSGVVRSGCARRRVSADLLQLHPGELSGDYLRCHVPPCWATIRLYGFLPVPAASGVPMQAPWAPARRVVRGARHEEIRPTIGSVSPGPTSMVLVRPRRPAACSIPPMGTARPHLPHLATAAPGPVDGSTRAGRHPTGAPATGALVDPSHGCDRGFTGRAVLLLGLPLRSH